MKIGLHRSFIILAALGVGAFAQDTTRVIVRNGDVHFFNMQMGPDKVVKGAPYTADAVTETVQTLANGTRITRNNTAQLARDGEGRTRREQTIEAVGPWATGAEPPRFIMINDPVAGVSYHLDPKAGTAVKMPAAKGAMLPPLPPPGHEGQFFYATTAGGPGADVAFAKMRAEGLAAAAEGPQSAGGMSIVKIKEPGQEKTESLGSDTIEGIPVTGTRTTRTIAAGAIGNDQPIDIVSETWYSKDLQMVIMSKHSDPQIGETTYRLTNIQQGEPPHSLFQVPSNYTIREDKPILIESSPAGKISK